MAVTIVEKVESRNLRESVRDGDLIKVFTRNFVIYGADDPLHTDVVALAPLEGDVWGSSGLYVNSRDYRVLRVAHGSVSGMLELTVTYGPPQTLPDPDTTEESIEITTETQHIKQALSQTHYPSGEDQFGNAINVTDQGVEGVDILTPKCLITCTIDRATILESDFVTIAEMTGKVNNATFKSHSAGTLLFLGMTAQKRGNGNFRCKYSFGCSPNVTVTIVTNTGGSQDVSKGGWQYMWMREVQKDDGSGDAVENSVDSVHVATVYESADFGDLGL